jgi:dienelactone hydrolase
MIRKQSSILAALAALAVLWISPVLAAPQVKPIEWKLGDEVFSGHLVYDDAGSKRPGLVMVPNWKGVKDVRPKTDAEAAPVANKLRADRPLLRARVQKAVEVLKQQSDVPVDATRIGAFGFCFGGTAVLELARAGDALAGIVSLHGGLATDMPATGPVRSPVLILNGADDRGISAQDIANFQKEMDAGDADWQFVNFSGAVHCFAEADANNPPGCVYHERSAKRAYRMMGGFFKEAFKM